MYKTNNNFKGITKYATLIFKWFRKKLFLVITAFMIGMSNVILEEDRTLNHAPTKTEQEEKSSHDEDLLN